MATQRVVMGRRRISIATSSDTLHLPEQNENTGVPDQYPSFEEWNYGNYPSRPFLAG
jgi:hypothetical protein